jgi:hypothetical protein
MKYGSVGKRQRKFLRTFHDDIITSREKIHTSVNKVGTTGLLTRKKQKYVGQVLTESYMT